jgi:hypothetical protein
MATGCSDGQLDAFTRLRGEPNPVAVAGASSSAGYAGSPGGSGAPAAGLGGDESSPTAGGTGGIGDAPVDELLLLDDFEDGDERGLGATQGWYLVDDGTGSQALAVEPLTGEASERALRTYGSGFSDWGAKLGLDLSSDEEPFDASTHRALVFSARAAAGSLTSIRVVLLDQAAHYGKDLELTVSWQRYEIAFSELTRPDGSGGLQLSRLEHLQFFAGPSAPFDYWIDDVAFAR